MPDVRHRRAGTLVPFPLQAGSAQRHMHRHVPLVAFTLAALLLGDWLGEDLDGNGLRALALGLLVAVIAPLLTPISATRRRRALTAALVAALYSGAFFVGDAVATRAFNACVNRGEDVRQALLAFYGQHGAYPAHLSELRLASLPGDRLLRPNILFYQASSHSFVLGFADAFATHTATPDGWSVTK